ncbi:sirohydrochlorin cobaltochelatase [Paenibacillus mucilaginosus]|uniref:sirohydrochlorin chelatase n=1 Tax=Paenibacillus mucilaginosus TaxID=61624 RepID=UPI003D21555E
MKAILFVGHGSRDAEGNQEVREMVDSLTSRLTVPIVETCFLEFEAPSIRTGIATCVKRGATQVAVVPITLFAAGHAKLHIPAAIDAARLQYPQVQFDYGRPIGVHELALDILTSRVQDAGFDPSLAYDDTALLVIGRGSSDADANSDLFKVSRLLWERLKFKYVETAFIGVTAPLADEGIERCIRLGAKRVIVLPYFLFTGVLIKRMEAMMAEFALQYPDHSFVLADYFGFHPMLREILRDRAEEALMGEAKANCDMCQYRIEALKHADHHHHDHEHGHDHHHHDHDHDHHHHDQEHVHAHDHSHGHDHDHDDHHHDHDHDHHQHDHEHVHAHDHSHDHAHNTSTKPAPEAGKGVPV